MVTAERPRDRYDQEVERLTANPGDIDDSWSLAKPLFSFCSPSAWNNTRADGKSCGCLTMIRSSSNVRVAWTDALTDAIKSDERLPYFSDAITPEHLPIFAEWQRRIDAELGRTPPPMLAE